MLLELKELVEWAIDERSRMELDFLDELVDDKEALHIFKLAYPSFIKIPREKLEEFLGPDYRRRLLKAAATIRSHTVIVYPQVRTEGEEVVVVLKKDYKLTLKTKKEV